MAASASPRACAHASSLSPSSETASAESLALQACDDVDSLHAVQRAYACIEKLIVPQRVGGYRGSLSDAHGVGGVGAVGE